MEDEEKLMTVENSECHTINTSKLFQLHNGILRIVEGVRVRRQHSSLRRVVRARERFAAAPAFRNLLNTAVHAQHTLQDNQ